MCQQCRDDIREIISGLLSGEHELAKRSHKQAEEMAANIREVAEREEIELPDVDVGNEIYEALIAAQIAIAAAHMASRTNAKLTTEGDVDPAMILGLWAGSLVDRQISEHADTVLRSMLGLGDN